MPFRVVTFNLRNIKDRWPDRAPLVVRGLVDLDADILGLQELSIYRRQGALLTDAVNRRRRLESARYRTRVTPKAGAKFWLEGVGTMTRLPVAAFASLALGTDRRVAQRSVIRTPDGPVAFCNVHLADGSGKAALREREVERLLTWLGRFEPLPTIVVGDMNAEPGTTVLARLYERFHSAAAEANGAEPARTVPADPALGAHRVLDYILLSPELRARSAGVAMDLPSAKDARVYPSDHLAVVADIEVA